MSQARLRILHIVTRASLGGGSGTNLIAQILEELSAGHDVHVCTGTPRTAARVVSGLTLHVVPTLGRKIAPLRDWHAYREMRELVTTGNFDVIHTHESKAGLLGRLAARDGTAVVAHTVHMASFGAGYNPLLSSIFQFCERLAGKHTDMLITVGVGLAEKYSRAGIAAGALRIVRSPVELERFNVAQRPSTEEDRAALRRCLGIAPSAQVILAAGMLERRKRYVELVRWLKTALEPAHRVLVVTGEGPERSRILQCAQQLRLEGRVMLPGHVTDLPRYMWASDIFVHVSRVEGVPQVVLQALAAGLPVVATEVEGLAEIDSERLHVVPRSGGASLRSVVENLLDHPLIPCFPAKALAAWERSELTASRARLMRELELLAAARRSNFRVDDGSQRRRSESYGQALEAQPGRGSQLGEASL